MGFNILRIKGHILGAEILYSRRTVVWLLKYSSLLSRPDMKHLTLTDKNFYIWKELEA